ncbi:MAG: type I 3-dehydroquinate dehydratase [Chloroflexi bacterium]|nr:type I 3-dehydroquinate dehydratase [Chloroflexota bacterium]
MAMRLQRNLCVTIAGPTMAEALATLAAAAGRADMVELRLDLIQGYDLERLLAARPCAAIATLRPRRQGGAYVGDEATRLEALGRAARLGAEWVDVELDAAVSLGRLDPARRIVSHHDFVAVPPQPDLLMAALWRAGADAAKLAAMVHAPAELAPLARLLAEAPGPSIVLGMGPAGVASRLLCLRSDACLLTYLAAGPGRGTAPGQLALDDAEEVYRARAIGPATRFVGYLGGAEEREALRAANAELARVGLDAVCVPLGAADAQQGLEALVRLALDGGLVPPALEAAVAGLVPERTPEATWSQEVNALLPREEHLVGAWAPDLAGQVRLLAAELRQPR